MQHSACGFKLTKTEMVRLILCSSNHFKRFDRQTKGFSHCCQGDNETVQSLVSRGKTQLVISE